MTKLSIILVNWNCADYTEQCIASIAATAPRGEYEVVVVDNNSGDAPCAGLSNRFPWVKVVLSETNLGFGRANNLGVQSTTGQYLLFLNPDTLVCGDALRQMVERLDRAPYAGAIGCRLLNADGTLQTSCVQSFPTILNQLLAFDWLKRRWPRSPLWGLQAVYRGDTSEVHSVDVISGACLMMRREAFEQAGGFRSEYFMYAEEVDLCHSIRRAGWSVVYTGAAEVVHFGGQSTKHREDGFAAVAMRDSVYRFLRRTRGGAYAEAYRLSLLWSALCRLTLLGCAAPVMTVLRHRGQPGISVRAFRKWLGIASWSLGWQARRPG